MYLQILTYLCVKMNPDKLRHTASSVAWTVVCIYQFHLCAGFAIIILFFLIIMTRLKEELACLCMCWERRRLTAATGVPSSHLIQFPSGSQQRTVWTSNPPLGLPPFLTPPPPPSLDLSAVALTQPKI